MAAGPDTIPLARVEWLPCWRIIPSRYPPSHFYERIAPKEDWEALVEIEQLTNPRIQDEIGQIQLIRPEDRRAGPQWGWINAAFTFPNEEGSRFSNGTYGVYYAGETLETAIAETRFHRERFYSRTTEGPMSLEMSVITAHLKGELHDLRGFRKTRPAWFDSDPARYAAPQALALQLHQQDSYGVVYPSVRHPGGQCAGVFRPPVLDEPVHDRYLVYEWDGKKIGFVYEKKPLE